MSIISTPTPPEASDRASLGGMPTEIKARIVELAWIQDEQYRDRWSRLGGILVGDNHKVRFGRSGRALFEVNREFSELSAKYLFQNISSWHDTTCTLFQHRILPLRARHFVELDVDPDTLNSANFDSGKRFTSILGAAGQLPNLRSLIMDGEFDESGYLDSAEVDEFERGLIMGSFQRLTSRVEMLSFYDRAATSSSLLRVLQYVPNLKKLELELQLEDDDPQDCRNLLRFISQLGHLKDLDLAVNSSLQPLGSEAWVNFTPTSLPHLTSLSCWHWHEDSRGLLSRFSSQLVELTTSSEYLVAFSSSLSRLSSTPQSYPILRKLCLWTGALDFVQGLESFSFPRVSSLDLRDLVARQFSADQLSNLLDHFPSLISLDINYRSSLSASHSTHLLQLCAQRNIHLKCNKLYSPFNPSKVDLPMTLAEHEARKHCMVEEAKRVVNFTARRIERLEGLGDLGEIEKMMSLIRGLAEMMISEKD